MKQKLTLKEIQQIEFDILAEFDRLCAENNLRYSLDGGTLIGAVRHKDFIPWDDDIDVIMPRPDYEKMCRIASKEFPKRYKILRNSYWPFVKILDLKTTVKMPGEAFWVTAKHLWIDVFPVDGLPTDEISIKRLFDNVGRLIKQQNRTRAFIGKGTTPFRAIAKIPLCIIAKIHGAEYYTRKIEQKLSQNPYESSELVGSIVTWYAINGKVRLRRDEFDHLIKLPFHGKEFYAIPGWNAYLRSVYGDYMQLPPEEKRKRHITDAWLEE